ncbi:MAG: glycosyltransferase family 2 protein [Dehalococcoidia bacterium]
MIKREPPRVSIGLPVYNGERYLPATLDSILAQTFRDFELIICDNASTDRTEEICRRYAAQDTRIRYERHPRNLGAQYNLNRVVHLATGVYFKWASHSDILAPDFLARCAGVLDCNPDVVLCFSRQMMIDEEDNHLGQEPDDMYFCAPTPHERLRLFFASDRVNQTSYGVIRTAALKGTPLLGDWYGADRALLMELALHGCFERIDENLFFSRRFPGRSRNVVNKAAWFNPRARGGQVAGYWKHLLYSARMLRRTPMSPWERLLCLGELARQGWSRGAIWAPILARELTAAVSQTLRPQRGG